MLTIWKVDVSCTLMQLSFAISNLLELKLYAICPKWLNIITIAYDIYDWEIIITIFKN
jgi:hypothetical protein